MVKHIFSLFSILLLAGCGVKGKPQPMLTPPPIGNGKVQAEETTTANQKKKSTHGEQK